MVIATGRSEGDIVIGVVGGDSGESEWWASGVGDSCGESGIGVSESSVLTDYSVFDFFFFLAAAYRNSG